MWKAKMHRFKKKGGDAELKILISAIFSIFEVDSTIESVASEGYSVRLIPKASCSDVGYINIQPARLFVPKTAKRNATKCSSPK